MRIITIFICLLAAFGSYGQGKIVRKTPPKTAVTTTTPKKKVHSRINQIINGHEAIDLGLSVRWASYNVGTSQNKRFGTHFILRTLINSSAIEWGTPWRLPTYAECQELIDKCRWEKTSQNFIDGVKITGPSGKSIFLPAAGYLNKEYSACYKEGYYITSSHGESYSAILWFSIASSNKKVIKDCRFFGVENESYTIRAVTP